MTYLSAVEKSSSRLSAIQIYDLLELRARHLLPGQNIANCETNSMCYCLTSQSLNRGITIFRRFTTFYDIVKLYSIHRHQYATRLIFLLHFFYTSYKIAIYPIHCWSDIWLDSLAPFLLRLKKINSAGL